MFVFTNIDTIEAGIKTVGGSDLDIADATFINLLQKWYVPIAMGDVVSPNWRRLYLEGLTVAQNAYVGGKPFMFTTEGGKLIAYTLDYFIPAAKTPSGTITLVINPNITNDGNDKIKKLDGGDLEDSDVGTSWTVVDSAGEVKNEDGDDVLTIPPLSVDLPNSNPQRFPCPMLLITRESS